MALIKSQVTHGDLTVEEALLEFIVECRIKNLSPQTTDFYQRRLGDFLAPWKRVPLAELASGQVKQRILHYLDRGHAPATINGYIRSVKALLNWALREDYDIQVNPKALQKVKEPQRLMPHLDTPGEILRLLAQPDRRAFLGLRDHTMILLMLDTGIRVGELVALDVADVNVPLMKVRGKGDKERIVALSDAAQKAVMRYLRARQKLGGNAPFLFPSREGCRLSKRTVTGRLKRYGETAGIAGFSLSPHALRRTFATHFLRDGGSIVNLQRNLGHTTLAMSRKYAQIVEADAFEDARKHSPIAGLRL